MPSPMHVVHKMIEVAQIKKGDVLYDMGSGDGRIVIEAAKKYGIRGVGIDLDPDLVAKAKRECAANEGVSHLVEFRAQDGLTADISEANGSDALHVQMVQQRTPGRNCKNSNPVRAWSLMISTSTMETDADRAYRCVRRKTAPD